MAKGRRSIHGISVQIEYEEGDWKEVKDDQSTSFYMNADYGFFPGTSSGEEGEDLDVFVGPNPESEFVAIVGLKYFDFDKYQEIPVHQEDKVMVGFKDMAHVMRVCSAQYPSGMIGAVFQITLDDLKEMIQIYREKGKKDAELLVRLNDDQVKIEVPIDEVPDRPLIVRD